MAAKHAKGLIEDKTTGKNAFNGSWGPIGADCEPLQEYLKVLGVPEVAIEFYGSLEFGLEVEDDTWTFSTAPPGSPEELDYVPGGAPCIFHEVKVGKTCQETDPSGNKWEVKGEYDKKNNSFTLTRECKAKKEKERLVHEIPEKNKGLFLAIIETRTVEGKEIKGVQVFQRKKDDEPDLSKPPTYDQVEEAKSVKGDIDDCAKAEKSKGQKKK